MNSWIDLDVLAAMDYFSSLLTWFLSFAIKIGTVTGVLGLIWSGIKLTFGTFTVKQFWMDTFKTWFLFVVMLNLYYPFCLGVATFGNFIGVNAGNGQTIIVSNLTKLKKSLENDIEIYANEYNNALDDIQKASVGDISLQKISVGNTSSSNLASIKNSNKKSIWNMTVDSSKSDALQRNINESYMEKNASTAIEKAKTLEALKSILVEKHIDYDEDNPEQTSDNLISSYVVLDIWLKDSNNKNTSYLSPAAILRLGTFVCQIMWEKNQLILDNATEAIEKQYKDKVTFKELTIGIDTIGAVFKWLPNCIMTAFCCIFIIAAALISVLQYSMCILEYTVITSIGAFFIPFILFDGTKDIPKKIIPVLTSFCVKLLVINIVLMYVFYTFIKFAIDQVNELGGMSWVTIATIAFQCFLTIMLTLNAPKFAETLLTGQPRLSLGEAVQTARGIHMAGHVAKKATEKGEDFARGAVNKGVSLGGSINKAHHASKTASSEAQKYNEANNFSKDSEGYINPAKNGRMAARQSFTGDFKSAVAQKGSDWLHGNNSSGRHGGNGSGGSQAFQQYGQTKTGETLNNTSNAKFQQSRLFDKQMQGERSMSSQEYMAEKARQGENIGKNINPIIAAANQTKSDDSNKNQENTSSNTPENPNRESFQNT